MDLFNHPSIFVFVGLLAGVFFGFLMRKRYIEGHSQNIKEQAKQLIEILQNWTSGEEEG